MFKSVASLLLMSLAPWVACLAQSPVGFRYFYYDSGELFRVLDSTGTLIEYIIDPSRNITQVNRSTIPVGSPAILNFTPMSGVPGSTMIIYGQNFSSIVANNVVTVNGVTATVLSATSTQLVIQIPANATTGQIAVTVNGVTVSSGPTLVFVAPPAPLITSVTPDGAIEGKVLANVAVTGANLTGSTFSFPAGATAITKSVSGSAATIQVTTLTTQGIFPLVATAMGESSTSTVTAGNHFIVMSSPDQAVTPVFSVLNTALPASGASDPTNVLNESLSQVVSLLNQSLPASGAPDPTNVSNQADSRLVSLLNQSLPASGAPDPTNVSNEADSALISLLNGMSGSGSASMSSSALTKALSFASGFAKTGVIEVAQSGALSPSGHSGSFINGQLAVIGVRAPPETQGVRLQVNGALLTAQKSPYVFTFNVPAIPALAFTAIAIGENGVTLASYSWQDAVMADTGTTLAGRVLDATGMPVAGAPVVAEASGFYSEFFELRSATTRMPDMPTGARKRAALVSGLDWLNPDGAFGDDPMGVGTAEVPDYAVRYSSEIFLTRAGSYEFMVQAQTEGQILIDGTVVSGKVTLTAGTHAVEVRYYHEGSPAQLQVTWRPPGGTAAALPVELLSASDPGLAAVTAADGTFTISGVPAKVDGIRVVVTRPGGASATSQWQEPVNGAITALGDIKMLPTIQ